VLTVRIFTHPACAGCGPVVKSAWELESKGSPAFRLETVSLADKAGLDEAFARGIKTIPTVVVLDGENEVDRIVGTPAPDRLRQCLSEKS
jgi:predicted thioredoxin/glutaredoxin